MRRIFVSAFALLALTAAYIASPLVTVWGVREAIRSGDSAFLAETLEWPTVRASLRASLTDYAIGPTVVALPGQPAATPTLWQRLKAGLSRRAVDNLVESYVTPEGLPQLFGLRQLYRNTVPGEPGPAAASWYERAHGFWSRLKRAEFHSLTEFEIEIADRNDPTRHYVGLLKLRGMSWKLTELRLRTVAPDTGGV